MSTTSMVSAMAELAEAAGGDVDAEELLTRLVDVAAQHLGADAVGVVVNDGDFLRAVHSSHTDVEGVERLQQLMQEGPCHDALVFQIDVVVDDLADPVQTAWPDFVDRALSAGLRSVVAVPMISRGRVWGSLDLYRRRAGTWQPEELEWARLLAHLAVSYVVLADDRDRARQAQQELAHRSTHDALTGLPNRVLLFDRLEQALRAARRHQQVVAVLFVDLDRFKAINDTFGHAAGDQVLATVATRMREALREEDTLARLAGDEFVVLCEDLPSTDPDETAAYVEAVCTRLRRALDQPVRIADVDTVVSASIGVAFSDEHPGADDLLADADAAMYRVKHHHDDHGNLGPVVPGAGATGARIRVHRSARRLERELAQALPLDQLQVHYQPITDPAGAVRAVEALLRWHHPEHGLLTAADFVDLAAGNGTIAGIGHWVIEETCAQMARWQVVMGRAAPQTAFVNLSARELADPALTSTITTALDRYGLQSQHLGLELLESSFIDPQVLPSLHEQQRRGHPLSVDDFGTGYSSLSRLVDLPVKMAKIDRSFIAGITHDARRRALVDAVVAVARSLDLQVVAEGVETRAQARAVIAAGCHYLQGFYCGPPQPADVVAARWTA